jgi:hypothetical protein
MAEEKKICNVCGNELPLSSFYKDKKGGKFGVRSLCIACFNKKSTYYRKTKEGLITQMYHAQKQNSILRGHELPDYSKEEWLLSNPEFHKYYDNWVDSGYNKWMSPSCDRKSSLKPYSFSNLQLGTLADNLKNENIEMRAGLIGGCIPVIGINKKTGLSMRFVSTKDAGRKTGAHFSHVSACCLGKRKSAGGYTWRYEV